MFVAANVCKQHAAAAAAVICVALRDMLLLVLLRSQRSCSWCLLLQLLQSSRRHTCSCCCCCCCWCCLVGFATLPICVTMTLADVHSSMRSIFAGFAVFWQSCAQTAGSVSEADLQLHCG